MKRCYPKKLKVYFLLFILLVVFLSASAWATSYTSSTEFCLTCHEMDRHAYELSLSPHAKDKDGKPIACSQCHLPHSIGISYFAVKAYSGAKDLYIHNFGDPNSLDRVDMQVSARRFMDDENCLACHADLMKDAKGEKEISALGKLAHDAYLGKNGNVRNGCANCHTNIAHLPSFDYSLPGNETFYQKLQDHKDSM